MKSRAVSDIEGFLRPQQANKGGSQALNRGLIMHTEQCCARLRHNRGSSEKQGPSPFSHRVKAAFGTGPILRNQTVGNNLKRGAVLKHLTEGQAVLQHILFKPFITQSHTPNLPAARSHPKDFYKVACLHKLIR